MWIRWYTVGPQTYMRIGPGGAGSSTFCRVDESYSSTPALYRVAGQLLLNCASSVEPLRASVELSPPETAWATRSK